MTRLEGTKHGHLISLQMLDVAVRVESIRSFACNQMVNILRYANSINQPFCFLSLTQAILLENAHVFILGANSTTVAEVLYAAAWICGEFAS